MKTMRLIGTLLTIAMLTAGCSTFDDDYEMAMANQSAYTDITGPWVGTWQSEANDHNGPMRALVSQLGDGAYQARYKAEWGPGLKFETEVHLRQTSVGEAGVREFIGSEDLGWMYGGVYQYKAKATPTQFNSSYSAEKDHGTYTLKRP